MAYRRSWQRDFDRSIREHPDWPVVVSEGDSWFSYPHERNVVDFLDEPVRGLSDECDDGPAPAQRDWSLLRRKRTSDEILSVMAGGERAFLSDLLKRYEIDALLLSAGGYDLIGADLGALLKLYVPGITAADCLEEEGFVLRLRQVEDCYRRLIDMVLDDGADLKVLVNSYDAPLPCCADAKPRDRRSPGPWLRPAFTAKGYSAGSPLEREIPYLMLDRFCVLLDRLASEVPTRFHRVETRGAVGGEWADEIHPNARGAKAVAQRFEKQLQRLGLVQVATSRPIPILSVRKAS